MFNNLRVLFKQAISGFCNVCICNWNVARNQLANVLYVCLMFKNFLSACVGGSTQVGLLFASVSALSRPWSNHLFGWYFCYIQFLTVFFSCERYELLCVTENLLCQTRILLGFHDLWKPVHSDRFQELPILPTWWSHFSLTSCSPVVYNTVLLIPRSFVFCSAGVTFWVVMASSTMFQAVTNLLNHDHFRFLVNLYHMQKLQS